MSSDAHLEERYRSPESAAAYRDKYGRHLLRRISSARELAIVGRALQQAGPARRVLDCPCGAGRLVPTLLESAEHVTAVDRSAAMVEEAARALADAAGAGRVTFAVASADALPYPNAAFDVAVCHRLLHHVKAPEGRQRILREMRRVARHAVLLSFHDARTWKRRWQSLRGQGGRRVAWRAEELQAEARDAGLVLEPPFRRLAGWFSPVAVAVFRPRA